MHMDRSGVEAAGRTLATVLLLLTLTSACGGEQAAEPATPAPSVSEPSANEPSANEPSANEPSVNEPSVNEPSPEEPTVLEPSGRPTPGHSLPGSAALPADGDIDLAVRVTDGAGTVTEHSLTCAAGGEVGGSHPSPADACADLYRALERGNPFAPVDPTALCTQQYGGPETAEVTGTVGDVAVTGSFSLTDGCQISRWSGLGAVLGAFAGSGRT